ncbi:hypothetical protein BFF78_39525 [Streptomyces fodineus]|uniref:Uncharacterized protein n=1 Tax=Streptomyces fodineus TaxID=1904616 RepID=A0A1D7YLE2_9ACTN|nr:hypothetical protein BFF78_39525 [Streptomyces fodineus]
MSGAQPGLPRGVGQGHDSPAALFDTCTTPARATAGHILVHSWIEGHMSDHAVFTGPAEVRPGRAGLAPCIR